MITREIVYIGTIIPKPWVDPRWGGDEQFPWSVLEGDKWRFNGDWKTRFFPLEWCQDILNQEMLFSNSLISVRHVVHGDPKQGYHLVFPMYSYKGVWYPTLEPATKALEKDNV